MDAQVHEQLQALASKVEGLRQDAYKIIDGLADDYKRQSAATFIVDRLDLLKAAIQDVVDYPDGGTTARILEHLDAVKAIVQGDTSTRQE